jgi:hypothetical protein
MAEMQIAALLAFELLVASVLPAWVLLRGKPREHSPRRSLISQLWDGTVAVLGGYLVYGLSAAVMFQFFIVDAMGLGNAPWPWASVSIAQVVLAPILPATVMVRKMEPTRWRILALAIVIPALLYTLSILLDAPASTSRIDPEHFWTDGYSPDRLIVERSGGTCRNALFALESTRPL